MLFAALMLLLAACGQMSYMQAAGDVGGTVSAAGATGDALVPQSEADAAAAGIGALSDGMDDDAGSGADEGKRPGFIFVQVAGAVTKPGVYEMAPGSRIFEAIEQAGGETAKADDGDLNLATPLTDGQKIYVRTAEEQEAFAAGNPAAEAGSGLAAAEPDDGKVSINTASEAELMTLPGIGQTRAAQIIRYREEHGGFTAIEDIMQVEGIKQGTFRKFCDNIKL